MKEANKRLGRILKKARKESGRTISTISKESNVRRELIEKVERGDGYHIFTLLGLVAYYQELGTIKSLDVIQDVLK